MMEENVINGICCDVEKLCVQQRLLLLHST